jgi:hypothetical protein
MKLLLLAALFPFAAPITHAQDTKSNSPGKASSDSGPAISISAAEAKNHTNVNALVTGKVVELNKTARTVYLNFEKPFPNQVFSAIIFAAKTNQFANVEQYKDKIVEVTGKIIEYRNRPEIILESTNQIRIVEKPAETEKKAEGDKK